MANSVLSCQATGTISRVASAALNRCPWAISKCGLEALRRCNARRSLCSVKIPTARNSVYLVQNVFDSFPSLLLSLISNQSDSLTSSSSPSPSFLFGRHTQSQSRSYAGVRELPGIMICREMSQIWVYLTLAVESGSESRGVFRSEVPDGVEYPETSGF